MIGRYYSQARALKFVLHSTGLERDFSRLQQISQGCLCCLASWPPTGNQISATDCDRLAWKNICRGLRKESHNPRILEHLRTDQKKYANTFNEFEGDNLAGTTKYKITTNTQKINRAIMT